MSKVNYRGTVVERFWRRIEPEPNSGCWLWIGATNGNGYAKLSVNGRMNEAHRVSYEMFVGKIPIGLDIDHLCRIRSCVNPNHLRILTRQQNVMCGQHPNVIRSRANRCLRGHTFDYVDPRGHKRCRECRRQRDRRA